MREEVKNFYSQNSAWGWRAIKVGFGGTPTSDRAICHKPHYICEDTAVPPPYSGYVGTSGARGVLGHRWGAPFSPIRPYNPPHAWGALQSKVDRLSTQPQRVLNLLM
ncbi:hypothetical protein [Microcoleus sp. herbarium14]|uniref:hypothetical protein n=1 Tax=Microcoleus sp. herbarium14 TaxID=3055439 RepID=UPI002FD69C8D